MDDNFRKGFIVGIAMNPLYVVTQQEQVRDSEPAAITSAVLIAETISELVMPAEIPEGSSK